MSYLATFIFLLKIMELGAFLIGTDLWTAGSASHAAVTYYTPELKDSSKDISILGGFMNNYTEHVIAPGAKNILPYTARACSSSSPSCRRRGSCPSSSCRATSSSTSST